MVDKLPIRLQEHLVRTEGPLGQLVARARQRDRLLERVRDRLPAPLNRHCQGIEQESDTLCLVMSSPAWVARTRYLLPQLTPELVGLVDPPARNLRVRAARQSHTWGVRSGPDHAAAEHAAAEHGISAASRKQIRSSARHIRDPELRAAMERLGREPDPPESGNGDD